MLDLAQRWWAPDKPSETPDADVLSLLDVGDDPRYDLGAAVMALHRSGAAACEEVARAPMPDERKLVRALATTRAALADPLVDTVSKVLGEPTYSALLVRDLANDADSGAVLVYRRAVAGGVAPPLAATRAGLAYGVPSAGLGPYLKLASAPATPPLALIDAADRVLWNHVSKVCEEEVTEEISKAAAARRSRYLDEHNVENGPGGRFVPESSTAPVVPPVEPETGLGGRKLGGKKLGGRKLGGKKLTPLTAKPAVSGPQLSGPKLGAGVALHPQNKLERRISMEALAPRLEAYLNLTLQPGPPDTPDVPDKGDGGVVFPNDLMRKFPVFGNEFWVSSDTPRHWVMDLDTAKKFVTSLGKTGRGDAVWPFMARLGNIAQALGDPEFERRSVEWNRLSAAGTPKPLLFAEIPMSAKPFEIEKIQDKLIEGTDLDHDDYDFSIVNHIDDDEQSSYVVATPIEDPVVPIIAQLDVRPGVRRPPGDQIGRPGYSGYGLDPNQVLRVVVGDRGLDPQAGVFVQRWDLYPESDDWAEKFHASKAAARQSRYLDEHNVENGPGGRFVAEGSTPSPAPLLDSAPLGGRKLGGRKLGGRKLGGHKLAPKIEAPKINLRQKAGLKGPTLSGRPLSLEAQAKVKINLSRLVTQINDLKPLTPPVETPPVGTPPPVSGEDPKPRGRKRRLPTFVMPELNKNEDFVFMPRSAVRAVLGLDLDTAQDLIEGRHPREWTPANTARVFEHLSDGEETEEYMRRHAVNQAMESYKYDNQPEWPYGDGIFTAAEYYGVDDDDMQLYETEENLRDTQGLSLAEAVLRQLEDEDVLEIQLHWLDNGDAAQISVRYRDADDEPVLIHVSPTLRADEPSELIYLGTSKLHNLRKEKVSLDDFSNQDDEYGSIFSDPSFKVFRLVSAYTRNYHLAPVDGRVMDDA